MKDFKVGDKVILKTCLTRSGNIDTSGITTYKEQIRTKMVLTIKSIGTNTDFYNISACWGEYDCHNFNKNELALAKSKITNWKLEVSE